MKKKVVSLLIAGLMMLEPCTMADAADLSDTEVIEQSVESAGDSVETEAMGRLQRRQEILQNPGHRIQRFPKRDPSMKKNFLLMKVRKQCRM